MRPNWSRITLLIAVGVLVAGLAWGGAVIWSSVTRQPLPLDDQCRASVDGAVVTLTPEQARNATLIGSVALRRGLPARAVTIAVATAYQESGIRNLDYGHADSIGLFQQRPSKGWGTVKQIMDPLYSAGRFYTALVKVKGWRSGDINDVAQAVQRSGHPNAYRKHVSKAILLSTSLTGAEPGSFTCKTGSPRAADPDALAGRLRAALKGQLDVAVTDNGLVVNAGSEAVAWMAANLAVAHAGQYGVSRVSLGGADWTHDSRGLAPWTGIGNGQVVSVEFSR